MKSFIAKRLNSILVNLRYLRFKLLKYKENNKKICNTFDHNFKNIPLYIMRKVSLERYYFVLYDCALTSKMSKMALKSFCDKTLQISAHCTFTYSWLTWPCLAECGRTYLGENDTVVYIHTQTEMKTDISCLYLVHAPPPLIIQLQFERFDLINNDTDCAMEYVEVGKMGEFVLSTVLCNFFLLHIHTKSIKVVMRQNASFPH